MIRAVVADDEPLARRGIRQLLAAHADVSVIAEARNGCETLEALRTLDPDLLFLDVQMPELDGFGVLRERGAARMPAVVFVTAHDDFAVRAFDAQALDYLVKPVEEARFTEALKRVRERLRSREALAASQRLAALLALYEQRGAGGDAPWAERSVTRRLLVPTATGDLLIALEEIDWIEADDYYAAIHARGRRFLLRESLAALEQRLDAARFVRVHRKALVNVERIRELRSPAGGEMVLVLHDGTRVSVSRRRRDEVLRRLRGPES